MTDNPAVAAQEGLAKQFSLQRVYLRDVSFESPNPMAALGLTEAPSVGVQVGNEARGVGENLFEVVLTITVTARVGEDTLYLVEVKQAGLFTAAGFEGNELGQLLGSYCPNILFPFVRETVADLVSKGGYPQLLLQPINFDMLYMQFIQQQQQQLVQAEGAGSVQ
ncbi:MAG: protein-export chaperone SecB [Pseudomonadota bacterium]